MTLPTDTPFRGIEAVVIDLDGTLVDTLDDFVAGVNAMLADLQLAPLEPSVIEHVVGKGSEHLVLQTLKAAGAPESRFDEGWPRYLHHYGLINGTHAVVYSGVSEGLRAFAARGLKLAVLTNKPVGFARALLEAVGLADYFQCVHGGDSFARKKPDPLPLIETCRVLGVQSQRVLMVGDSGNDAAAARAAGCPVALVTYGYNHGLPIRSVDADAYVDRLDELVTLI